jgi:hypothetical protein
MILHHTLREEEVVVAAVALELVSGRSILRHWSSR